MGARTGTAWSTGGKWFAPAPSINASTACCSSPTRWTPPSATFAVAWKSFTSPPTRWSRNKAGRLCLVFRGCLGSEDGPKAALFILIVQQHHQRDMQCTPAIAASGRFALQILHESVRKMVAGALAACRLGAALPAMRTHELNAVFLRVAVKRGPAGVAHANSLFRMGVVAHKQTSQRPSAPPQIRT